MPNRSCRAARKAALCSPHGAWHAALVTLALLPGAAHAAVSVLRPPREATTRAPLTVTLVYSGDETVVTALDVPEHLDVTLTNGDVPPRRVTLTRASGAPARVALAHGELKAVRYQAPWPDWARGTIRIDVPGMDVSPAVVALTREPTPRGPAQSSALAPPTATVSAGPDGGTSMAGATPSASAPPASPESDVERFLGGRLSAFEPIYFADGAGARGDNVARFQVSFKFRLMVPDDPRSRAFLDNLYIAYTQTSLWDMRAPSGPFRDTSYMPQAFYYLPDTGWRSTLFTRMGIMAGVGHESNGRDGAESRGLDIVFVRPTWDFGDLNAYHLTVSPKIYYYLSRAEENHDIADYRGYVDLLLKYGSPDGWQLAATLRKGTKAAYGSVDTQLTYPLAKLFGNAWGGYLWLGYFNGYGEDILEYNQHRWIARVGFSVAR